jgi:hypothetical protein
MTPSTSPSTLLEDLAQAPVENVGPGVTLRWLAEGQIAVFQVTSIAFESIDAWVSAAIRVMEEHPSDRPYHVLHDFSSRNMTLTPYLRQRIQEALTRAPKAKGRLAGLVAPGVTNMIVQLFVNTLRHLVTRREFKVFTDEAEALAWLAKGLES